MRRLGAELARATGKEFLSQFYDLQKFYDSVDVLKLIDAAIELNFDPVDITLCLQIHLAPRILKANGAYCIPQHVANSILQGCSRSNSWSRLFLHRLMEDVHKVAPEARLGQHVDDVNIAAVGDIDEVVNISVKANSRFVEGVTDLRLTISQSKSHCVASRPKVSKAYATRMRTRGLEVQRRTSTRDLGLDAGGGRRRAAVVFAQRVKQATKRASRYAVIANKLKHWHKGVGKTFNNTGLKPAATYGHTAYGVPPTTLSKLRAIIAVTTGYAGQGHCVTTLLHGECGPDGDPAVYIRTEQVDQWLKIVDGMKSGVADAPSLVKAWQLAQKDATAANRWKKATGPVSATVATLADIGWQTPSPFRWVEPCDGEKGTDRVWYYTGGDSAELKAAIADAASRTAWREAAGHFDGSGAEGGVDFTTFQRHIDYYHRKQLYGHAGMLKKIAYGQMWNTERQHHANSRIQVECDICGEGVDNTCHRAYGCSCIEAYLNDVNRRQRGDVIIPSAWKREAIEGGAQRTAIFWCRGLPPKAWYEALIPAPRTDEDETVIGEMDIAGGHIYSDGSGGRNSRDKRIRRCGYGYALIYEGRDGFELVSAAFGPLPGDAQTVPRAELMAVTSILSKSKRAFRDLIIHVDCKYVVRGWLQGKGLKPASNRDLWDRFWELIDQVPVQVSLVKVQSHLTDAHVAGGDHRCHRRLRQ